jgi:hypothetical protein
MDGTGLRTFSCRKAGFFTAFTKQTMAAIRKSNKKCLSLICYFCNLINLKNRMKTLFAILFLAFGLSLAVNAQCGNVTLLTGCVGACGSSWTASYTVQPGDVGPNGVGYFCLSATSSSLCPSHNAAASMTRLGTTNTGNLNLGDVIWTKALVGDVIDLKVDEVFVNPKINCIWQGQTDFSFMRL